MTGLVADIGRVTVRFGLVDAGASAPRNVKRMSTSDYSTFTDALLSYLRENGIEGKVIPSVLAVSGAVQGTSINLTGSRWHISLAGIGTVLRTPPVAMNEAAANALALTLLSSGELSPLPGPKVELPKPGGTYLVIGCGTGLGVSTLATVAGRLVPLHSEAAHMSFAVANDDERALADVSVRKGTVLSNEALLSPAGLIAAHALFGGHAERAEDVTRADAREQAASRAVDLYIEALGAVVGNLVLAFAAWDGVYLTGAIARALQSRLSSPKFRQRIEAKAAYRRQLSQLPIAVINRGDLELIGATAALAGLSGATIA